MRVGCVICSDPFTSFTDVSSVPCGHTFHTHCILQWIENAKSCPTCRHKTLAKNVKKLYFDVSGAEHSQNDLDSLQNQLDSLKFQLVEKTQILKNVNEENSDFKKQNQGLRDECVALEKRLKEKENSFSAYKEQLRHMEKLIKNASQAEEYARIAKAELKLYKGIKILVEESSGHIEETILSNSNVSNSQENIKNLSIMNGVLKGRVNKLMEDKRKYADENAVLLTRLKETKKNLTVAENKLLTREGELNLHKQDVNALEKDIQSLQKKIKKLQAAVTSPSADVKNSVIQRLISESPAPLQLKKRPTIEEFDLTPEITRKVAKTSSRCDVSFLNTSEMQSENEESQYFQVKSASITAFHLPAISVSKSAPLKNNNSIFKDERNASSKSKVIFKSKSWSSAPPVYPNDAVGYDGLGGHHKVDHFPSRTKANLLELRKKKPQKPVKTTGRGAIQIPSHSIKNFLTGDPFLS